ncbi:MAG: lipase family protein [Sulfuriferula sp.]
MATILELAELSAAVYGDHPIPSGWSVLTSSTQINPAWAIDGYYGVAYQNTTTGEIVIANRGTDLKNFSNLTNLLNLESDVQLALHEATQVQTDAANFSIAVANLAKATNPNVPIIETGHSLGGSEAQAATVALTAYAQTHPGFSVSAVTFNSPGIGGYLVPAGVSYTVQNFYDQGDAIHLAGGNHLGSSTLLPAGPNTASLALTAPMTVAAGPTGIVALLGTALWDVVGPAHSIDTVIGYLQGNSLGQTGWSAAGPATPITLGATGTSTGPTLSVNAAGALVLTDASGDSVTLTATADQQSVIATFSGSGSAVFQQLTAMGTVTIPVSELNQAVTGLASAATINETVTQNPINPNTFDVAFQNTGMTNGEQFIVNVANSGSAFNYVLPGNGQAVIETIDSGNNTTGTVSIITGTGATQLTGGTAVAGKDNTWTDGTGDQYVLNTATGALTISQGVLGANSGDRIVIDHFNLNAAQTNANGYLGIKFGEQLAVVASASMADDPFTNGGTYTHAYQGAAVPLGGNVQAVAVNTSTISATDQIVSVTGGSAWAFISTGANLLPFNGTLNLIIPAGQDHVTFGLVDTSNSSSADTLNLSASLTNADGAVSSNALTVTFDSPATVSTSLLTGFVINGDQTPVNFGTAANPQYETDLLGNIVTSGSSPNFNDTLFGSSGNDRINTGGGNDYIQAEVSNNTCFGGIARVTFADGAILRLDQLIAVINTADTRFSWNGHWLHDGTGK